MVCVGYLAMLNVDLLLSTLPPLALSREILRRAALLFLRLAMLGLQICCYEDFCRFRVDGIAIGAQSSHSCGSPINQRE